MKAIRIYTKRMALYIESKGFKPIGMVPDVNKPHFLNWFFEDTPAVRNAMTEYSNIFYTR